MKLIRKTAKLLTLPILNKNKRKETRAKVEKLLHRVFKTEHYRCEQAYLQILQDNRALGFERYHLVSLGYNCFGRMTFNYWGLKPRKADGEKTMPFDISVHPLPTVIKLLQTRFADYFDNMVYDQTEQCWKNPDLGITFVHDHENDAELFKKRYANRIEAFYAAVEDERPCLFFAYTDTEADVARINELNEVLKQMCPHKRFKLVYMIFNHPLPRGIDSDIAVYRADYPQDYVHMDINTKYRKSGFEFEAGVVDYVRRQIERLLREK